jgi:Fe-S-cluster containining protein
MPVMPYEKRGSENIFKCRNCGDCCRGYGGTYVTREDIEAIAEFIHADSKRFVEDYCQMSGSKPVLAQREGGYCIFWDQLCTIHPVKPRMCRRWPYIKSILVDPGNWLSMADSCPGIVTELPVERIVEVVQSKISKERTRK